MPVLRLSGVAWLVPSTDIPSLVKRAQSNPCSAEVLSLRRPGNNGTCSPHGSKPAWQPHSSHHRADFTEPLSGMDHRTGNCSEPAQSCVLPPALLPGRLFTLCWCLCCWESRIMCSGHVCRSVNAAASLWESDALRDLALCFPCVLVWNPFPMMHLPRSTPG